jgi:hypothetical protein
MNRNTHTATVVALYIVLGRNGFTYCHIRIKNNTAFYMPHSTYLSDTDVTSSSLTQNVLLVPNQHGETYAFADMPIPNNTFSLGNLHVLSNHTRVGNADPEKQREKTSDDYLYQFYLGSITVVGLFILFRFIQKS